MKRIFLSAAAIAAISATGASAQVVGVNTMTDIINGVMANASANFAGIAVNDQDINGFIDINSTGSAGGSTSEFNIDSETIGIGSLGITNDAEQSSLAGGGLANIAINSSLTGIYDCDVSAVGDASSGACGLTAGEVSFSDTLDTTSLTENGGMTSQEFGAVSALAAGAVNDTTLAITEVAGTVSTAAEAATSNTSSSSSFDLATGSGVSGFGYAGNEGIIDGSATINLAGGNIGFESIGTTAAGAISTTDITASFIGEAPPAP
ncbi:hypothetical protein C2I36_11430 [Rhodobacteraceae bacterium WD3A24]|nr:hypothetical protein C2I36_11430 [Rhodobacteraceae bacterium WD3A24]